MNKNQNNLYKQNGVLLELSVDFFFKIFKTSFQAEYLPQRDDFNT